MDKFYESEKFSYQLYHYIATGFRSIENYQGKHVLEIGSGRGGGLAFIVQYLKPVSALGIDFSRQQINFCKKNYKIEGLNYSWGDAENLPLKSESVDYIICIESSHCFGNFRTNLSEVKRVLKKGGHYFLADFLSATDRVEYEESFENLFTLVEKKDISENVLASLRIDSKRKIELINKAPYWLRRGLKRFAGIEGSTIYNQMEAGDTVYMAYHFINNSDND